jgi:hypothetical protein
MAHAQDPYYAMVVIVGWHGPPVRVRVFPTVAQAKSEQDAKNWARLQTFHWVGADFRGEVGTALVGTYDDYDKAMKAAKREAKKQGALERKGR